MCSGVLVLVEFKCVVDIWLCCEVVGQMFDYVVNGIVYWQVGCIVESFIVIMNEGGCDFDVEFVVFFDGGVELD